MKEIDSSVVRQCGRTEGYAEFCAVLWQFRQTLPKRYGLTEHSQTTNPHVPRRSDGLDAMLLRRFRLSSSAARARCAQLITGNVGFIPPRAEIHETRSIGAGLEPVKRIAGNVPGPHLCAPNHISPSTTSIISSLA